VEEERRHVRLEGSFPKGSEQVGQHVKVIDVATETEILDVDSVAFDMKLMGCISGTLAIMSPTEDTLEEVIIDSVKIQPQE
jgi:hypothetical protein